MSRRFAGTGMSRRGARETAPSTLSIANAGADATFDMLSASPCSIAGSAPGAVGSPTYLWTKLSGPGTVAFASATSLATTCTFTADGTYSLDLAVTDSNGTSHDQVTITVTATLSALLTRMATSSRVSAAWQTGLGQTDLFGGVSELRNQGADTTWNPQSQNGSRPTSSSTGGPNANGPCITFPTVNARCTDVNISIAAGKQLSCFAVVQGVATAAARSQMCLRDGATENSGDNVFNFGEDATPRFNAVCKTQGSGADQAKAATSPAHDTNWHIRELRYRSAGNVPEHYIDKVLSNVAFTQTGPAAAVEHIIIGSVALAAGAWFMALLFESVSTSVGTACLSERDAVYYYICKASTLCV